MGIISAIREILDADWMGRFREAEQYVQRALYHGAKRLTRLIMKELMAMMIILFSIILFAIAAIFFLIEYIYLTKTLAVLIIGIVVLIVGLIVKLKR